MFIFIRADHFNIHQLNASRRGDFAPGSSALHYGIHTINDDCPSQREIAQRKRIGNHVATTPHIVRKRTGVSNRLLNRIDPQIQSANLRGEPLGDSGFFRCQEGR